LLVVIFYSFYPFIFSKNFLYDYFYIIFVIIVNLSWILCNHECIFSYLYKKIYYKNYNCGDTTTLDDFNELTGDKLVQYNKNKNENEKKPNIQYGKIIDNVFMYFYILSVIITCYRSKLANLFVVIFVLIIVKYFYLFLNDAIGWNKKDLFNKYVYFKQLYNNSRIQYINDEINLGILLIMILFFIYITYKNRKRF
jgi:hypothetical protein